MPEQTDSHPMRRISKDACVASTMGSSPVEASYAEVHAALQTFKLGLATSSQALQDAPESRSALMASLETHLQRISPLYLVPPEIWARIFKLVLRANLDSAKRISPTSSRHTLQVIGNVCQGWRTVIQSLPELWSKIWLQDCWRIPSSAKNELPAFLLAKTRILTDVVKNSRNRPLDITILLTEGQNEPVLVHTSILILTQHSYRWARFHIYDDDNQLATRALMSSMSSLGTTAPPLLERFEAGFGGPAQKWFFDSSAFPPHAIAMPGLPSLSLQNVSPGGDSPFIPWSQLNGFSMSSISAITSHLLPEGLTSLVNLTLHFDEEELFATRGPPKLYELPNVETVYVTGWNAAFFSTMRMPKLRILEVEEVTDDDSSAGFADFITRSKCVITKFFCHHYENQEPDQRSGLQRFLHSMPGLQTFSLDFQGGAGTSALLELLNEVKKGQMRYCPELQVLDLGFGFYEIPLFTRYVDAIESRWRTAKKLGTPGLLEVGTIGWDDTEESEMREHAERLERLREEGLEVVVPRSLLNYT